MEEEASLRRHADGSVEPDTTAPDSVHEAISQPGAPLEPGLRAFLEPRFGQDFGHVRLHTGGTAARSAQDVGALAYTVGRHVVFRDGQFAPGSPAGIRLLSHELAHVAQNGGGAAAADSFVRRTTHGPGTPTNCHNWTIPLPPWIAGTIAHGQISTRLRIPPHLIPRAIKLGFMGTLLPPSGTPPGFADLWSRASAAVRIAEIKSTATGSTVASAEAAHYILRHNEWLARETGGTADVVDAAYLATVGPPVPGGVLDLSSTTGSDLILGNFWGDPAKLLHIEADAAGAMVYWCTGTGVTGSPAWLPLLKKALDELAKKMKAAKRVLQEAAAKLGEALGAIGRAVAKALLPILVTLLILAIVALFIIAIICLAAAPETAGLTLICTALGLLGTVTAAAALLFLIGIPAPSLPTAAASVFRRSNPATAAAEPESGADYERDTGNDSGAAPIASQGAASSVATAFNPGDDLIAALSPLTDRLADPIGFVKTVTRASGSLSDGAVGKLTDAVAALDSAGDSVTAAFIRQTIQSSGLDKPGALAAADPGTIEQGLASLGSGPAEAQPPAASPGATSSKAPA